MLHYHNKPEKTREVLTEDGWSTFPLSNVSLSFYMDDVTTVTFIKRILMSQQLKKTVHQVRVQKPDSRTLQERVRTLKLEELGEGNPF